MQSSRRLIHAWLLLLALSVATTLLTFVNAGGSANRLVGATVLVLAGIKGRVILARYLGLETTRFWTRTFDFALVLFLMIAFGLYMVSASG